MCLTRSLLTLICLLLVACGGSDNHDVNSFKPVQSIPNLNPISMPLTSLVQATPVRFERYLKNGVYLRSQDELRVTFNDSPETSSDDSSVFSTTNVQEQGVDESDRIKYDGEYLFIANQHSLMGGLTEDTPNAMTSVRIMQRGLTGEMLELSTVTINQAASYINGLYLRNNTLAVLSNIDSYHIAVSTFVEGFFPTKQQFNLSFVDTDEKQTPSIDLSYTIDGAIVDSRRIDNMLYIVSSYRSALDTITYTSSEQEKLAHYNTIMQTDISQLLPQYSDGQGNQYALVDKNKCYLPESATELDGFDGVVTITAINLDAPSEMHSVCVNAQVQGLYASQSSLYLYGTEYGYVDDKLIETSVVHKFSIADASIDYRASAMLDGRFNWNLSNLRFSEQGDYLRVVTTTGDRQLGYAHRLNVLIDDGEQLSLIAQLPNATYPQPIGKVSDDGKVYEDIKAVRFFNNQAFIVTFLNLDPLYVINLSDNRNPLIAGALDIPGYSAYLHPISDQLLLGVGQNVDPRVVQTDSTNPDESSVVIEGAKVTLFDIASINAPHEIDSIVYPEAYTPVEFDYHALSYLTMNSGATRFALPIERWHTRTLVNEQTQEKYDIWTNENALSVLEVTSKYNDAQLHELGRIKAVDSADEQLNVSGWNDRSIFHQDDVYYIHGSKVWHSRWADLSLVYGPY
ncbi:beta-propeller domain-containing protein [Thalassotalea sp. G2M2-11]|uniref:beta-propeller domain-containing protein n=1 Tax=Thalassotalea sp. G2M2-11 TaxID=2787627 RepID=UPI0019D24A42|nr:beta-propeller domain-containing protein [Thalassotalea sp. G2M2-11]